MTQILLIDLSSVCYPIWHMSASEPNPNATSEKSVERIRALASGQPYVAICADSGKSFRKDIDPTYKSQRPEHDAALQHQITLAMETLQGDGFPVWAVKGYEADDLLASAASQAYRIDNHQPADLHVMIASSDKDLLQLVGPKVTVKSLTNGNEYDEDAVLLKFGVRPDQMVDYLALVGDASDNIKGATGIGPKGASKLLSKYGTLEDLYADLTHHGTNFTPALATALREFEPRMATVRELIRLRIDAPLPFDEIFRERMPQDVAVFGDEPVNNAAGRAQDIDEAMPTLQETLYGNENVAGHRDSSIDRTDVLHGDHGGRSRTLHTGGSVNLPLASAHGTQERSYEGDPRVREQSAKPAADVSTAIALLPGPRSYETQLEPQTYAEAKALAADLFAARLFNGYGSAPAVLSTIIIGRELGLSAGASLRGFHIIDGKHAMAADLIRARVLASPVCEYFRCTARTAEKATFVTKRKGDPEIALTYTMEEGKQAFGRDESTPAAKAAAEKAWKASGWGKNPADMLIARCSSKLSRLVYPDIVHGFYAPEELD